MYISDSLKNEFQPLLGSARLKDWVFGSSLGGVGVSDPKGKYLSLVSVLFL